jgi:hypothetical protein
MHKPQRNRWRRHAQRSITTRKRGAAPAAPTPEGRACPERRGRASLCGLRCDLRGVASASRSVAARRGRVATVLCGVTRVGAATNGDGAPPGMRHPTHTQERSMGSFKRSTGKESSCSVARAWLRRSGACYAATALGPPATTGAMPAAAGIPAGARTSGCSGERRHESERPTSQSVCSERGAPGGAPCEI